MKKPDLKSMSSSQKGPKKQTSKVSLKTLTSIPDEKKHLVLDCIVMRFTEKESLAYLKSKGINLKRARFYEIKKEIEDERSHIINQMALDNGFAEAHLSIINSFRTIERELWINYHMEREPVKKASILRHITETQVYLAEAYDVTKEIIREQAEIKENLTNDSKSKTL